MKRKLKKNGQTVSSLNLFTVENSIIILDFGSQYTQLIARKIRELHYYAEIYPYNTPAADLLKMRPAGIILSGGPSSVYEEDSPRPDMSLFNANIPILGICYGMQIVSLQYGGKVEASAKREYGKAHLKLEKSDPLWKNIPDNTQVWMSHGDKVAETAPGFETIGTTGSSPHAAIRLSGKSVYAVQFHPEVMHTLEGKTLLSNFCSEVCRISPGWTMENFAKSKIQEIQNTVGDQKVILGLSGGVDSMVTAKLIHDAIGDQLTCVYVDNGLMRLNETQAVVERFGKFFHIDLKIVDAGERFLGGLKGVTNPEDKRKFIGKKFVEEFAQVSHEIGHHEFLAQGTLYTDVIESVSVKGPSDTIKSHHNRVAEILELLEAGRVIEPLKELFKDEVRELGLTLGMPRELVFRHPFPGPGLAIRIIGEITPERLDILRRADAIFLEELKKNDLYDRIWQAFAVFLPVQSVGVMGDKRTYENVIALRAVESADGMTADFGRLPHEFLGLVSNRIINEISGINRVVYDISSKPPATIEWE